jgi:hypothetical protein
MVRIVLGVVLLVVALGLIGCGLYLRRAKRRIRRRLGDTSRSMTVAHPRDGLPYGMVDLPGTITSPATLTAPVTGSLCVMWELTVFSVRETEDGPSYAPVWITGRTGDVTIAYERRFDQDARRHSTISGPGSVSIPGDRIRVGFPVRADEPAPREPLPLLTWAAPTGAYLVEPQPRTLVAIGAPPGLADAVRAGPDPGRHRRGPAVRRTQLNARQAPSIHSGRWLQDGQLLLDGWTP